METKAQHNPAPIPRMDGLFILNRTVQHAPPNMMSVVNTKVMMPIFPVRTQIYTYSESGGISVKIRYLLLAGTCSRSIPMPIPQGASLIYFLMDSLLTSRTFKEASLLSNAVRIRLIEPLLFPILVKAKMKNAMPKVIPTKADSLTDFAKTV